MITDERWSPLGELESGRRLVGVSGGEPYDLARHAPDPPPRPARWGVTPRAALALLVVALLVAAGLVVRAAVTTPEETVQPAIDPAAASVPAAGPSGEQPAPAGSPPPGGLPPQQPDASASPGPMAVHVVGAVVAPGVVEVAAGSRVADAVSAAGGLTAEADPAGVNLARPIGDGEQVVVPRPGETAPTPAAPAGGGGTGARTAAGGAVGGLVDLNAAGTTELDALPGIGPVLAQRIVDFREANGPFTSVEEIVEVPGIGDAVLASLTPLVRV